LTEPRRRRGSKREAEAPELDEEQLVAELRRRAWEWLHRRPIVEAAPVVEIAPVVETAPDGPAPANDSAPPAKRKRAPRRAADGGAALRRKAWTWLRPRAAAATEVEAPKRRRGKRDAAPPEGVAEMRRRAWAWFAPRATGEAAAGTHAPARVTAPSGATPGGDVVRAHLKGVLEALVFASEHPLPARELARIAQADPRLVKTLLAELVAEYQPRGVRLEEVAGGFVFRTSPVFAPFVREQAAKKPVKMSRAQIETLAIVAYRQPVTRPEVDDVRGVDSGAVLKSLLERELVRIIGKKDEPGRPMLYGTTASFLEFFGLKALGDLPTLREFTELTDESRRAYEREMGEVPLEGGDVGLMGGEGELRRPEEKAPVDVAALEDDPTLPVPEVERVEEGQAREEEAVVIDEDKNEEEKSAHEDEKEKTEVEAEDKADEDEDKAEEDDEDDEDDEDEDDDDEDDDDEDDDDE
jgi:segregation and condensation protein B